MGNRSSYGKRVHNHQGNGRHAREAEPPLRLDAVKPDVAATSRQHRAKGGMVTLDCSTYTVGDNNNRLERLITVLYQMVQGLEKLVGL